MKPQYRSLRELICDAAPMVRPPTRMRVSEAAEKLRYINNPGSYVGPWDNDFAPYLVEVMDTFKDLNKKGVVFCAPVRSGKSDIFFNWCADTAEHDPADMLAVQMTQNTARDWSKKEFQKAIRHSPGLRDNVLPGSRNQNTHDVQFKNGMSVLVKYPSITELSGKTIPRHFLFDYDHMNQDVGGEGSPFYLAMRRGYSFRRYAMTVAESTPGGEVLDRSWSAATPHQAPPTTGILNLYNQGDRRRWYWNCPHCHGKFEPDFELLVYEDLEDIGEAAKTVFMACPHCFHENGAAILPSDKYEMNKAGKWIADGQTWTQDGRVIGTARESDIASFWLKGPCAAFSNWPMLVKNYLTAKRTFEETGDESDLKNTTNTDQAKPYVPVSRSEERVPEELQARAKELGEKVVPYGVRFLTASVDIQKRRFVVQIHGHMPGDDTVIIDRFDIQVSERYSEDLGQNDWVKPHAYPEDWHLLIEPVLKASYPLCDESGRRMLVKASISDSGGLDGVTENAYEFWRFLRDEHDEDLHKRLRLTKGGKDTAPRVRIAYPDAQRRDRRASARGEVPVIEFNTNMIKNVMDNRLDREEPGGGMILFPKWLPNWWYVELVAERKIRGKWANPMSRRNESWDLLNYSHVLCLSPLINIEHIDWENPPKWAAHWDENSLVYQENEEQPFKTGKNERTISLSELGRSLA